jgi:hypothetical protein
MDTLKNVVKDVVAGYASKVWNGYSTFMQNADGTAFTVMIAARRQGRYVSGVSVAVRIIDDLVIIERDQNDKLVVDALTQAGVPREQIILAYAGEAVPEAAFP